MGDIDCPFDLADQSLILKGDKPHTILGFFIPRILICCHAEVLMEEMNMKIILDSIFFLKIIDEDEMMGCIGNLPKKVNPVPPHTHKKSEDVPTVSEAGNPPANYP